MDLEHIGTLVWRLMNTPIFSVSVGATGTFFAIRTTVRNEAKKARSTKESEVRSFCKAVQTELECILKRYMESLGETVKQLSLGEPFLFHYVATEDYFAVFNSNAHLLGKIDDDALRTEIVNVYFTAKGLLDSFRKNNELLAAYEMATEEKRKLALEHLSRYSSSLVRSHDDLVQQIGPVIAKLTALK